MEYAVNIFFNYSLSIVSERLFLSEEFGNRQCLVLIENVSFPL